jgi:hypothetical protein
MEPRPGARDRVRVDLRLDDGVAGTIGRAGLGRRSCFLNSVRLQRLLRLWQGGQAVRWPWWERTAHKWMVEDSTQDWHGGEVARPMETGGPQGGADSTEDDLFNSSMDSLDDTPKGSQSDPEGDKQAMEGVGESANKSEQ